MKLIITDDFGANLIEANLSSADVKFVNKIDYSFQPTPLNLRVEIHATLVGDEQNVMGRLHHGSMKGQPISLSHDTEYN